jgi:hypothetical protein
VCRGAASAIRKTKRGHQLLLTNRVIMALARRRPPAPRHGGPTLPHRGTEPSGEGDDHLVGDDGPPLEPEEELLAVLRGIGSVMFLTSGRIILARDRSDRRPRTGIQSFPLESVRLIRLERGTGPSARIVMWGAGGPEAVSMFVDPRALERADAFVATSRLLAARRRRAASPGPDRGGGTPGPS